MTSWSTLVTVVQLLIAALLQTVCRTVRFSAPLLHVLRWIRRRDTSAPVTIFHPDEITSATLSAILKRDVVIIGRRALGDGKMSTVEKISFIAAGDIRRDGRLCTEHVICKSSPASFGQAMFSSVFKLHLAEIEALRRARLSPALFYAAAHWTGQYVIVMEFVEGDSPRVADGLTCPHRIEAFVVELARFHKETLHFDLDDDLDWADRAWGGYSGPGVSLLQKVIFGAVWRQAGARHNPKEVEARRPLIEFCLGGFPDIQWRVLQQYPSVLAHGDLHCGNMVVTGDGRIRLVDWQASCVRPLFYDLCYFLGTSVPIEVRRRHMQRWVRVYLNEVGLGHVPDDAVADCLAVCTYAVLLPLEFMAFLIQADPKNGAMHFEATGRRALAMLDDYQVEERLHALLRSEPNAAARRIWEPLISTGPQQI